MYAPYTSIAAEVTSTSSLISDCKSEKCVYLGSPLLYSNAGDAHMFGENRFLGRA